MKIDLQSDIIGENTVCNQTTSCVINFAGSLIVISEWQSL